MANKLISQLSSGAANIQDTDLMEGQKNGELITKKFTGLQVRAVEKAEREAQDNVIEASCGINVDGSFTAPANSWSLRAADYTAGCTDRGGATGALAENIYNGLRLLDARVYQLGNGSVVVLYSNLNADTTLTNVIPAGYMLQYCIFQEKAAASPILDMGTTAGGNQVFINQALTTSGLTTIVIERVFSLTASTTLYLNDDDASSTWDAATVDLYVVMKPVVVMGTSTTVSGTIQFKYYTGAYGFTAPPLDAEIEAVTGAANTFVAGTTFVVNDTSGSMWLVTSNATAWSYLEYTLAL